MSDNVLSYSSIALVVYFLSAAFFILLVVFLFVVGLTPMRPCFRYTTQLRLYKAFTSTFWTYLHPVYFLCLLGRFGRIAVIIFSHYFSKNMFLFSFPTIIFFSGPFVFEIFLLQVLKVLKKTNISAR